MISFRKYRKMKLLPIYFYVFIIILAYHSYVILYYRRVDLKFWTRMRSRDVSHYITLKVNNVPDHFCLTKTTLLVLVHSRPSNTEARKAIRETWSEKTILTNNNVSLFFLLGLPQNHASQMGIHKEAARFGDIIQEEFVDSYLNLTLKSVTMLKLFRYRDNCKYLLKVDDNTFVNLPLIVKMLRERKTSDDLFIGRLISREKRITRYWKKWYSPTYMYRGLTYPDFLAGPGYLMSLDVGKKLYEAALDVPIFHLEDVYLTGLCAQKAGIRPHHDGSFTDYKLPFKMCLLLKFYTFHAFTPEEIRSVHVLSANLKIKCPK